MTSSFRERKKIFMNRYALFSLLGTIIFLVGVTMPVQAQLSGTLEGSEKGDRIFLSKIERMKDFHTATMRIIVDSATVDGNGHFEFSNFSQIDSSYLYRLGVLKKGESPSTIRRDYIGNNYLFAASGVAAVNIRGEANAVHRTYRIEGSHINERLAVIRDVEAPIYECMGEIMEHLQTLTENQDSFSAAQAKYRGMLVGMLDSIIIPQFKRLLEEENDPRVAALLLHLIDYDMQITNDTAYINEVLASKDPTFKEHPYIATLIDEIDELSFNLPIGMLVPNIALSDPSGNNVSLHQTKGTIILVDFWASWCSPCREENRTTIRKLYEKYKPLGFEVFGVSLDDSHTKWTKALAEDEILWIQVSDLLGRKSPVWATYKLESLPTTYLLDSQYRVLAKNKRGRDLEIFLEKYFSEQTDE